MFGLFKQDPRKKLEAAHRKVLEEARDLQRNGDIQGYAAAMARAEEIAKQIEEIEARS